MPHCRAVTRLEELGLSSIVKACSIACTRLEEELAIWRLSASTIEDLNSYDLPSPVSSNNQVSWFRIVELQFRSFFPFLNI